MEQLKAKDREIVELQQTIAEQVVIFFILSKLLSVNYLKSDMDQLH